jgi:hypothetical protein
MRKDMDEIIIERPRWGSRMGHKRRAGRFTARSKRAAIRRVCRSGSA